ncbi:MAG: hypothetical protein ABIP59_22040 [Roseateles sp.]
MTDPEVLEFRFPVRLNSCVIRPGTGGAGRGRRLVIPAAAPKWPASVEFEIIRSWFPI